MVDASRFVRLRSALAVLGRSGFVVLLTVALLRTFVTQNYVIVSGSMSPGLVAGDVAVADKLAFGPRLPGLDVHLPGYSTPGRGDIVTFRRPGDEHAIVKRVVGLPGDTLAMEDGHLLRNHRREAEPYARHDPDARDTRPAGMSWMMDHLIAAESRGVPWPTRDNWGPLVVPSGRFFVLGDNREDSLDSRYWGFVDQDWIRDRLVATYYSFHPEEGPAAARWDRIGFVR